MTKIRHSDERDAWVEMLAGAKPCIRPDASIEHQFSVRFPCGGTALYFKPIGAHPAHEWSWEATPLKPIEDLRKRSGVATDPEWCLRAAWCAVLPPPPALPEGQLPEPHEVDSLERGKYTALMRAVLRARTGEAFACRGDSGTAYSWLTVTAPPKRCDGSYMTARDQAILSAIFGESVHFQGQSIPPTRGYRSWHLYRAAGYSTEAITLREHAWSGN